MQWNTETRYKILLEINNAIATCKTRPDLFLALSQELHRHFAYDRMCIILYDSEARSIAYFAAADGIQPGGVVAHESRPLAHGDIARMVVQSRQPVVFDDLARYTDLKSVGELVKAGLTSTMVFPMIIRDRLLGTIHLSFRKAPQAISELTEVLKAVSQQIAIAVDNMMAYTALKQSNMLLQKEKQFLLTHNREYSSEGFFFASPQMQQIIHLIDQVADTDETVLITGETGTGKDFLARMLHDRSNRCEHLFVKTNCPGLTNSLFESELFGHAKGAFTGAEQKRSGRFELAEGGTIFLDEIGDLSTDMQAKLLQVLQERKFERVGESVPTEVDSRVIAATNKDLQHRILEGEFRQDLFYRLETVTIHVPPLRQRREDIPLLINNINASESDRLHRPPPVYSDHALDLLCSYHWPGNVRELKNMVKRLIIMQPGSRIRKGDIEMTIPAILSGLPQGEGFTTLDQAERNHIMRALKTTNGVIGGKNGAAKLLGMHRSTLQYRIKKLGINSADFQ